MAAACGWLTRALPLVAVLGLGSAGMSGCHTYKYVDVTASFDQATIDDSLIGSIDHCKILVTGADSNGPGFRLAKCPNRSLADPHVIGTFEYSTFADSGTLNIALRGYAGMVEKPECLVADGTVAVPLTADMVIMTALTAKGTGTANCTSVSPPTDGGP